MGRKGIGMDAAGLILYIDGLENIVNPFSKC